MIAFALVVLAIQGAIRSSKAQLCDIQKVQFCDVVGCAALVPYGDSLRNLALVVSAK